jgi:hypothetical protein
VKPKRTWTSKADRVRELREWLIQLDRFIAGVNARAARSDLDRTVECYHLLWRAVEKILSPRDRKRVLVTMFAHGLARPALHTTPHGATEPLASISGLIGHVPSLEVYRRVTKFYRAIMQSPRQPRRDRPIHAWLLSHR